jgi:hypothetical protein
MCLLFSSVLYNKKPSSNSFRESEVTFTEGYMHLFPLEVRFSMSRIDVAGPVMIVFAESRTNG